MSLGTASITNRTSSEDFSSEIRSTSVVTRKRCIHFGQQVECAQVLGSGDIMYVCAESVSEKMFVL